MPVYIWQPEQLDWENNTNWLSNNRHNSIYFPRKKKNVYRTDEKQQSRVPILRAKS